MFVKRIFVVILIPFLLTILCFRDGYSLPAPFRIAGTVEINGTQITDQNDDGLVIKVTKSDGSNILDAGGNPTVINGINFKGQYYKIDIPVYDSETQSEGAEPGSTLVLHVYMNGNECDVTSPTNGQFIMGESGGSQQISIQATCQAPPANKYNLTVNKQGDGDGTVTSAPVGIDCGDTCSAQFDENTQVTLTATPAESSVFAGWGGDCSDCGNNTQCTVTMGSDKTCMATFSLQPQPDISVDTNGVNFGNVNVGSQSNPHQITITNEGSGNLVLNSIALVSAAVSGGYGGDGIVDFDLDLGTCFSDGQFVTLGQDESCTFSVTFKPQTAGAHSARVKIESNDPDEGTVYIDLTGNGVAVAPNISVNPAQIDFGNVSVGNQSQPEVVTVSNNGNGTLNVTNVVINEAIESGYRNGGNSANFALNMNGGNDPCGSTSFSLAPGKSCTFTVTFTPQFAGTHNARVEITSDDPDQQTAYVDLTGTGVELVPDISVSPIQLNFGDVNVGSQSQPQQVTIENDGDGDLVLNDISLEFPVAGGKGYKEENGGEDFNLNLGTCFANGQFVTLAPGDSCTFSVTFTPQSAGQHNAKVKIGSNDPDENPTYVDLKGNGIAPSISVNPASWDFGKVAVGGHSDPKVFTVENTGSADLHVESISLPPELLAGYGENGDGEEGESPFTLDLNGGNSPCGDGEFTLSPNESCTFSVTFSPQEEGQFESAVRVTSDDPDTPNFDIELEGEGFIPGYMLHISWKSLRLIGPDRNGKYIALGILSVSNSGASLSPVGTIKVYLSEDEAIDEDDTLIAQITVPRIFGGKSINRIFSSRIDPPSGDFYLIAVAEAGGQESDPASKEVKGGVDLVPKWLSLKIYGPDRRERYRVKGSFEVENQGSLAAGRFFVQVYYSEDGTLDVNTDKPLLRKPLRIGRLSPGRSRRVRFFRIMNEDPEGGYFFVKVDIYDNVKETDESNNVDEWHENAGD